MSKKQKGRSDPALFALPVAACVSFRFRADAPVAERTADGDVQSGPRARPVGRHASTRLPAPTSGPSARPGGHGASARLPVHERCAARGRRRPRWCRCRYRSGLSRSLARLSGVMQARKIEIVLPRPHPDEQPNSLFSNSSFVGTCRFSMMDVITLRSRLKVSRMSWDLKLGCPCAAEERLSSSFPTRL